MATPKTDEQTLLDAFRYVSNEMDDAERMQFEAGLESDAAAQQALVDVVCLSEAVAIGTCDAIRAKQQRSERRRGRRQTTVLVTLAGALAFVCLALVLPDHPSSEPVVESAPATTDADSEVVSLWSELRSDAVVADSQLEVSDLGLVDDTATSEFPTWMIAASLTDEPDRDDAPNGLLDDELDEETL